MKKTSVLIIGDGRIGQAVAYSCRTTPALAGVDFLTTQRDLSSYDLFIGALPGERGQKCLALALHYRKGLLDISDVDPPFYVRHKKAIKERGILVIPGCGFSPGLVNFILGRENSGGSPSRDIEIKAGSLARVEHYFPFLWCFEDLMLEHGVPSRQVLDGKEGKYRPFDGYRRENIFGIAGESYYCASGFEDVPGKMHARNFVFRVVRPHGFREFFLFLRNQGFLGNAHRAWSQRILEGRAEDNITFAEIVLSAADKKTTWLLKSFSRRSETLNSMQKITAAAPAILAGWVAAGTFEKRGLLFMEDLGKDPELFSRLISALRARGIEIRKRAKALTGKVPLVNVRA